MTRRSFLAHMGAALAVLGVPVAAVGFGYSARTFTLKFRQVGTATIWQWRTDDGIAMSPAFSCRDAAIFWNGPFDPLAYEVEVEMVNLA